jgi:peptide/nickel transport system substrate-binding protein
VNIQDAKQMKFTIRLIFVSMIAMGWIAPAQAKNLTFSLIAPPYRHLEANVIAEQLRTIGVQVEVRILEKAALRSEIKRGSRSAYLTDWGSAYFDPYDLAQPKITTGGRGNFSFYSNPKVDELLDLAVSSNDHSVRRRSYYKVQDITYRDVPWVFGYIIPNFEAAGLEVVNYNPSMDNRVNLHDVSLKQGDTIIVGMNTNAFLSLDPLMYRSRETETMIRNMFDALVTRTHESKVIPELAESWQQVDETVYIFTLRNGPRFHNGDPVTIDDVVFTFERVLKRNPINGKFSPRRELLGPVTKVEKINDSQVRFSLANPFPPFLQALVHFQIVPKNYIQKVGEKNFSQKPIGTGPFKFVKADLGQEVHMERFEEYYGGSPYLPPVEPAKVKFAVFKTMPEPTTRVAALLAGEVSIVQAVPANLVDRLRKSKSVQILSVEGTRAYQIELNNKKTPFTDIRVRMAMNYAINWDDIISNVYNGHGYRLATCFLPSGFGYSPALKPYPYNPEKAKALLREAGYDVK